MRARRLAPVVLAAAALAMAGCGGAKSPAGGSSAAKPKTLQKIGKVEGRLNLIAWAGYTENGKNDPKVDWVTPFEKQSGCTVDVKYGNTSDEMVTLMRQGGGTVYDGVSASGDATNRLIAAGDVAAINTGLVKGFSDISPKLQSPPHNTVHGVHYGVSYMWGANILMYNTRKVTPKPDSWRTVFEDGTKYAGHLTGYDSPIYIADAAVYLKATRPELKIDDPYELTPTQLDAATELLKKQHKNIKKYWAVFSDEIDLFKSGDVVAGQAWPYQVNALKADKAPVDAVLPKEGATGWADTWMMSAHARHPNCMYLWMNWATRPDVQKQVAEWFGASPANAKTCDLLGKQFCDAYHVTDANYFSHISFWKTPLSTDANGKGGFTDYSQWTAKWTEVKNS